MFWIPSPRLLNLREFTNSLKDGRVPLATSTGKPGGQGITAKTMIYNEFPELELLGYLLWPTPEENLHDSGLSSRTKKQTRKNMKIIYRYSKICLLQSPISYNKKSVQKHALSKENKN